MDTPTTNTAVPQPRLLTYADLPAATENTWQAFKDDPLFQYMHCYSSSTPDDHGGPIHRASMKSSWLALYTAHVQRGTAWTIEDGACVVTHNGAKEAEPSWSLSKLIWAAVPYFLAHRKFLRTEEQAKRTKEVNDKTEQATKEVLGDRKDSMIYLANVCTAPAKQGRGYASTLIKIVTAKADEQRRSIWLNSSNRANVPFYKSLGFVSVKEVPIGDDNPTWDQPPIMVDIMVREYQVDSELASY